MKEYYIKQVKECDSTKKTYSFNQNISLDSCSLFIDNNLLELNQDYIINNNNIILNEYPNNNSIIELVSNIDTNSTIINPGKVNKNNIYSRYNSSVILNENNKYTVNIAIDKDNYIWNFSSKRNPMFSSVKQILQDIGEFIEGFSNEYIEDVIYKNSVAVIDLINELANLDDPIENVTYDIDSDGIYSSNYSAVKNWVRYKSDIDLVKARYFGISYRYGSITKEIGDIKIDRSVKLPYINNLLDLLEDQYDEADAKIRGINKVASAVKGETNYTYEDWDRTTTFNS